MKKTTMVLAICLLVIGVAFSNSALAAPAKDDLVVSAQTSFGSAGNVAPTVPGNSPRQWFYAFCLPTGGSLNQTFPLQFQLNDANGTSGESASVSFNAVGSLSGSTTPPAGFNISDNSTPQNTSFTVATGSLADGQYSVNLQISATPNNKVSFSHDTIHIQVTVGSGCIDSKPSCFFTSSEFDLLTDCSGAYVTGNSGGTFQIVAPKGKINATNPGQFYYNMIWTNQGDTQAVTIDFSATNLNPQGANAVHALVFDSSGFTTDASNFDMVNGDGTPCGPSGPCTISVGAGKTLWVTWHLQYAGIGGSSSGISYSCPGNVEISATGTLKDSLGNTIGSCTATATGYLKK
jgi:hypothetical protein